MTRLPMPAALPVFAVQLGLAVLLGLAGCGGPPPTPDEAACARQANDDPAVKLLIVKGAGNQSFLRENEGQMKAARQDAVLRCLRRRGILPQGGGVERQKLLDK